MKFFGEVLIFVLLLLTNMRVFVIKKTRVESLVVLGPLSFILSILLIFSWGIDIFTALACILSFGVVLSNFHALIRFRSKLYIDHYSPAMKFWGAVTTLFTAAALIFTILFAPVELNNKKLDITETKIQLEGSFKTGFTPAENFSKKTGFIYEYTLFPDFKERKNVAVFVPDKRGDTYNYRPYLQLLAKEGITVCSADFYSNDCKWFYSSADSKLLRKTAMELQSLNDEQAFLSQKEFYTYNIKQELTALLPMLEERYGQNCTFFLISDVMADTAITDFAKEHEDKIAGTFFLDSVSEYNTKGYGCVEQTDPFMAKLLGSKRDKDCFFTKFLVLKSKEVIREAWLKNDFKRT